MNDSTEVPLGVRLLQRMLDEAFAAGRPEVVDEVMAPDVIEHQFGFASTGPEAHERVQRAGREVHDMAPDIRFTIEDWAQSGDITWVRATGRGTNTGPFFGAPSGRPFEISVIDVVRVRDGLITEHWGIPDRFALLAQAGVLDRLKA
ncbi:MAG TPA: ester cyclase [Pseudolysinimonas sp.]|jgi:predicted ester cyclase|nr:ester cyclase [Pseudolysinimonas sp.]